MVAEKQKKDEKLKGTQERQQPKKPDEGGEARPWWIFNE